MSQSSSLYTTRRGEFRRLYRLIRHHGLLPRTPIILCEGDSWFSTPLSMNLLDWLVFPTPEVNALGVPLLGRGGLFFRAEKSGDVAHNMFSAKNVRDLGKWFDAFEFDLVLLSAGGNDFVAGFLEQTFRGQGILTVDQAVERVIDTGRYERVLTDYRRFVGRFAELKPNVPILAHTYDYPIRLGAQGELDLSNVGLAAFFKKSIGDWIQQHIQGSIRNLDDQREFAKRLMNAFVDRVLTPVSNEFPSVFSFVDLRGTLIDESNWFDEMHPTDSGFYLLSEKIAIAMQAVLPAEKTNLTVV